MKRKGKSLVSIVVPAFNEETNLPVLYSAIRGEFSDLHEYEFELILVNDGSTDSTWTVIQALTSGDARVRGINLARNFGHAVALEAGMNHAHGEAIIMMDADLQHPPEMLPELIVAWRGGVDVVSTIRETTDGISPLKSITSRSFYRLINNLSDLNLIEGEADFRLVSKRVADALNAMPESPKFYRGLIPWLGYSTVKLPYSAPARFSGRSSYSLRKMFELARLGITSFSRKPLKGIIGAGLLLTGGSVLALVVMLITKLFLSPDFFSNIAILVVFLIFTTGILSTFQGIIALYTVDIFQSAKGRPAYIVSDYSQNVSRYPEGK